MQKFKLASDKLWDKWPRRKRVNYLDSFWSHIIRQRDGFKCVWCGSTQDPQGGHIFGRARYSTRWIIENGVCLCLRCNFYRQPSDPVGFTKMILERMPQEQLDELQKLSRSTEKQDYDKVRNYLDSYYVERLNNGKLA